MPAERSQAQREEAFKKEAEFNYEAIRDILRNKGLNPDDVEYHGEIWEAAEHEFLAQNIGLPISALKKVTPT